LPLLAAAGAASSCFFHLYLDGNRINYGVKEVPKLFRTLVAITRELEQKIHLRGFRLGVLAIFPEPKLDNWLTLYVTIYEFLRHGEDVL